MTLRDTIKELCKRNEISVNRLETELGFAKGYVSKLDKSTPNSAKLKSIADYFGVKLDYLLTGIEESEDKTSSLNKKDERDIKKDLDNIMNKIKTGEDGPLHYNGEEIDPESLSLLEDAINLSLKQLKIINKEKYNPNKNKK
ncbi:MAG: helix-turn-helix domain-containing protein [Anaerocolumna sp.]